MRANASTNAQKLFSQMLILRHFKEVNTQANTQRMHTYKPKTLFATIANAQPSIHAANRISKLFAAFVQIAYPLILLARENRGQFSYSLSIYQSSLFSHF